MNKYKNQKQIDEFRKKFPNGALDDMQKAYLRNIEQFIDQMLSERDEKVEQATDDAMDYYGISKHSRASILEHIRYLLKVPSKYIEGALKQPK